MTGGNLLRGQPGEGAGSARGWGIEEAALKDCFAVLNRKVASGMEGLLVKKRGMASEKEEKQQEKRICKIHSLIWHL